MMRWMIPVGLFVAGLALVLFVLLTDGRYFGKRLMRWVYDRLGPMVFSVRSETQQWRELARSIGLNGNEHILDVGTATGDLPLSIAGMSDFRGLAVGVDWSPRMIDSAQQEAKDLGVDAYTQFDVVDVRAGLPFESAAFDAVFCLGLLETLPAPERLLDELVRVLKVNGTMVLSLYRGVSSKGAALSLDWYGEHLGVLEFEVIPFRRHHDVVIARR